MTIYRYWKSLTVHVPVFADPKVIEKELKAAVAEMEKKYSSLQLVPITKQLGNPVVRSLPVCYLLSSSVSFFSLSLLLSFFLSSSLFFFQFFFHISSFFVTSVSFSLFVFLSFFYFSCFLASVFLSFFLCIIFCFLLYFLLFVSVMPLFLNYNALHPSDLIFPKNFCKTSRRSDYLDYCNSKSVCLQNKWVDCRKFRTVQLDSF